MGRAGQYQSLSEKIGEGHSCRRGSSNSLLTSASVPTAAALKPEQRPAAAPLLQAPHSRGSSTATPGSTPPRGSGSAPVQRSAATGGGVPRAVAPPTIRRESIVAGFTDADKEQAARLFSEYDDDGSGELDFDEFREARRRGRGWGGFVVGVGVGKRSGWPAHSLGDSARPHPPLTPAPLPLLTRPHTHR